MSTINATFYSENLMRKVNYSAIIPTHSIKEEGKLKTLYLLHGWNGNHQDWLHMGHIEQLAEQYGIAVVLPSGENSFYVDHPNGMNYGRLIGEELVSETRKVFALSKEREDTWIAGLSMGGYGALRNGLNYDQTFGKIVALSSRILIKNDLYHDLTKDFPHHQIVVRSFTGSDQFKDLPDSMDIHELLNEAENIPDLFIACGTEDYLFRENQDLHHILEKKGIEHEYYGVAGEHNWTFWNKYIQKALQWLTQQS